MSNLKPLRLLGAATALSISTLAAMAQSAPPTSPPAEKPPMTKPEAAPAPAPQTAPAPSTQTVPKSTAAPSGKAMVGLSTFASDGSKVGDVRSVKTAPDGKIASIQIKVGGFLGFGGRIVEISEGKFTQRGDNVHLNYTSDELSKLPEVKDAS